MVPYKNSFSHFISERSWIPSTPYANQELGVSNDKVKWESDHESGFMTLFENDKLMSLSRHHRKTSVRLSRTVVERATQSKTRRETERLKKETTTKKGQTKFSLPFR